MSTRSFQIITCNRPSTHRIGSSALSPIPIPIGEWCAATHSLDYAGLPDWFLLFDVYDRDAYRFWSGARRNALADALGLAVVPTLYDGMTDLRQLTALVNTENSRFRDGPLEGGIVIRRDSTRWCESRAKLVRAEFTQVIGVHWRSRAIEWNRVRNSSRR